jgi:hypothetical protein
MRKIRKKLEKYRKIKNKIIQRGVLVTLQSSGFTAVYWTRGSTADISSRASSYSFTANGSPFTALG